MNRITLKENEEKILPILWMGKETTLSYDIRLVGKGAKITLLALLIGKKTKSLNLKINVYHHNSDTKSKILIKGALFDNADINLHGLVKIEKGAKNSEAWLTANMLLLSDKAKAEAVPALEISEQDIKAGHAATINRINDMEIFYLQSRGISKKNSQSLIIHGFFKDILHKFPDKIARQTQKKLASFTY